MNYLHKIAASIIFLNINLIAVPVDKAVSVIEKTNTKLQSLQKKIDKSEASRESLLNEYKYNNSSLKSTHIYNAQLEKILESQEKELISLDQQIIDIAKTQKDIFPLMKDMIISLKNLVNMDTPFLLEERQNRIKRLENTLNRADIQTHEKYRIILEAFKIEYDYAKTIETYQSKIDTKTYNFLRIGRVALYTQSLDLKNYQYFNKDTKTWEAIKDMTSKSNIRKAIKIAKKQKNVDFLNLPFLAKKETK